MEVKYLTESHEVIDFVCNAIYSLNFENNLCGFDTEGTGLDPYTSEIRLYQFSISNDLVYVIDRWKAGKQLVDEQVKILFHATKQKLKYSGHNLKYELQMLWSIGICLFGNRLFDTMLAAQVIEQGIADTFNMKAVASRFLKQYVDKTEQLSDWSINDLSESQIFYAAKDTIIPRDLYHVQARQIVEAELQEAFKLEMRTLFPTASMEYNGVKLDTDKLVNKMQPYYEQQLAEAEQSFLDLAPNRYIRRNFLGEIIDQGCVVSSSTQVLEIFQGLGIPNPEDERELIPSTGKNIVKLLDLEKYPIVEALLNYRELSKLLTSFIIPLPQLINPVSGRLHTHYNQCVSTGRFCISEDTEIRLVGGKLKVIQDIIVGDYVHTVNEDNQPVIRKVLNTFYTGRQYCLKFILSDELGTEMSVLKCTPNHKIKTYNRGWVEAMYLNTKDRIVSLTKNAPWKLISSSSYGYKNTYDLEVEEVHSFIASKIVVHNSSSQPNLQQIPRPKPGQPFTVRECFIAEEGYDIVLADYSQIELRVIAEVIYQLTGDDSQLKEFLEGKDPYANTAAKLSGMSYEEFVALDKSEYKKRRQAAKAVRLGMNYCVTGDTKVIRKKRRGEGELESPITDVKVGDYVLTHAKRWKRVTDTQQVLCNERLKITCNPGRTIEMTLDHRMLVISSRANPRKSFKGKMTPAYELKVGDCLVDAYCSFWKPLKITSIELIQEPNTLMYDITVEDDHSFIANGLVSSNCMGATKFKNYARISYGVPMTQEEAERNRKLYFDAYPGLSTYHKMFQDKSILEVRTLEPFKRRRRWADYPGAGSLVNLPIQGCVNFNTRIHTSRGYIKIGELYQLEDLTDYLVWNGTKWCKFRVLNRGEAQLASIELVSGMRLECDTRHQLLCLVDDRYEIVHFSNLSDSIPVCTSLRKPIDWRLDSTLIPTDTLDIAYEILSPFVSDKSYLDKQLLLDMNRRRPISPYAIQLLHYKYNVDRTYPLFECLPIKSITVHDKWEETYTLEVFDDSHIFDSEGFISKNSSGDVQKLAMADIFEDLYFKGYSPTQSQAVKMILTIHDELELESRQDLSEEMVDLLSSNMIQAGETVLKYCPVLAEAKAVQNLSQKD